MTEEFQPRIFMVDDEMPNLKLLDRILANEGYTSRVMIQDPREVIARYNETRPDLILLDLNMPHLTGYQVIEQLKALDDPLLPPIVILTAQYGRDETLKGLNAGARDFIGKPFDRTELLMRVRNLVEAQLSHRLLADQKNILENLVQQRTEALTLSRREIVQRLGRASEYRDNETGMHIVRMSQVAALLARRLGWDESQCDLMLNASKMHDLGKIGIPDAILLKPGKLEPDEFEIMKTHCRIGAEILSDGNSELLALAHEIALTHHEKWDGSGYPQGLKGEDIPQSGRIAAVSDVFDALTAVRPYKKAWTVEQAVDLIRTSSGSHFDPQVVAAFLESIDEIVSIRKNNPDTE